MVIFLSAHVQQGLPIFIFTVMCVCVNRRCIYLTDLNARVYFQLVHCKAPVKQKKITWTHTSPMSKIFSVAYFQSSVQQQQQQQNNHNIDSDFTNGNINVCHHWWSMSESMLYNIYIYIYYTDAYKLTKWKNPLAVLRSAKHTNDSCIHTPLQK